jgi:hypothetical protein
VKIINPIDEQPMSKDNAKFAKNIKKVRREARRLMRSGNPKVRAEAARVHAQTFLLMAPVYQKDASERISGS